MRESFCIILILSVALTLSAQVPDGYYDAAEGRSGADLKSALYNIIKGHVEYPYTSSTSVDVWDILKDSDRDPDNSANVILLYSGMSVDASQEYNNGNGWTREHVWPKVHGNFGTEPGAGTDAHHLRPVRSDLNSIRNSRWFAECSTPVYYNGILSGCYQSSDEWLWKPRAEVVGDVARMIFYMATRYEGENGEPDLELVDYIPANNNSNEPLFARLSDLLAWNQQDPVDSFEMRRNNIIFGYQHNRNPFIDHPEYANLIWGKGSGTPMFSSSPVCEAAVGQPYTYGVCATAVDSIVLTISLKHGPNWLQLSTIGNGAATLYGTPDDADAGDYIVLITAEADNGQCAEQSFYISISESSHIKSTPDVTGIRYTDGPLIVDDSSAGLVQVFNMLGRCVASCANCRTIDVSSLKHGLYIAIFTNSRGTATHRFSVE